MKLSKETLRQKMREKSEKREMKKRKRGKNGHEASCAARGKPWRNTKPV